MRYLSTTQHPYIVVAPNYVRTSAGVRAMHRLCHALNRAGQTAFVTSSVTSGELLTPQMNPALVDYINSKGLNPIVIYPEIIEGNPIGGSCVVRYLLNFPGLLGGPSRVDPSEFTISWAKGMNISAPPDDEFVLYIPVVDQSVFYPPKDEVVRSGSCFYWEKYKYFLEGTLTHNDPDSFEIRRQGPSILSPTEIASLFRRSELFYCYENSMLSLEAMLCGCPVVLMPNEHFQSVIGGSDLGMDGMAWGNSPAEIERARATVSRVAGNYTAFVAVFEERLREFIKVTQERARALEFRAISYYEPEPFGQSLIGKAVVIALMIFQFFSSPTSWKKNLHKTGASPRSLKEIIKVFYRNQKGSVRSLLGM